MCKQFIINQELQVEADAHDGAIRLAHQNAANLIATNWMLIVGYSWPVTCVAAILSS